MQNLWRVQTEKKIHTPHDIISEQCKYLFEMTDGKVIARISPYKGDYKSYSRPNGLELAGSFFEQDNGFDVQNILGDQQSKFIYEFYITAKAAPKYKYRIMFVAFGISVYPVEVSLEKSIADEIGMDKSEFTLLRGRSYKFSGEGSRFRANQCGCIKFDQYRMTLNHTLLK